jgi:hypothetical protein
MILLLPEPESHPVERAVEVVGGGVGEMMVSIDVKV